jgi:N-acetyltransferase
LGIARLFVASTHRRLSIATHLLSAAARTFVHGCILDPRKGEIAFTQPTQAGEAVMRKWGGGGVRVYDEGQSITQL